MDKENDTSITRCKFGYDENTWCADCWVNQTWQDGWRKFILSFIGQDCTDITGLEKSKYKDWETAVLQQWTPGGDDIYLLCENLDTFLQKSLDSNSDQKVFVK